VRRREERIERPPSVRAGTDDDRRIDGRFQECFGRRANLVRARARRSSSMLITRTSLRDDEAWSFGLAREGTRRRLQRLRQLGLVRAAEQTLAAVDRARRGVHDWRYGPRADRGGKSRPRVQRKSGDRAGARTARMICERPSISHVRKSAVLGCRDANADPVGQYPHGERSSAERARRYQMREKGESARRKSDREEAEAAAGGHGGSGGRHYSRSREPSSRGVAVLAASVARREVDRCRGDTKSICMPSTETEGEKQREKRHHHGKVW